MHSDLMSWQLLFKKILMLSLNAHILKNTMYTNHSMFAQPLGYRFAISNFVQTTHFRGSVNAN